MHRPVLAFSFLLLFTCRKFVMANHCLMEMVDDHTIFFDQNTHYITRYLLKGGAVGGASCAELCCTDLPLDGCNVALAKINDDRTECYLAHAKNTSEVQWVFDQEFTSVVVRPKPLPKKQKKKAVDEMGQMLNKTHEEKHVDEGYVFGQHFDSTENSTTSPNNASTMENRTNIENRPKIVLLEQDTPVDDTEIENPIASLAVVAIFAVSAVAVLGGLAIRFGYEQYQKKDYEPLIT